MRRTYAATICIIMTVLAGCGNEPDPVAQLRAQVRGNPDSVELRLDLGDAYVKQEAYHDAFIQYSAAHELDQKSFDAILGLATVQEQLNNIDGALERLETALEMQPDSADALALQGKLMLRTDEPEKAIDALARSIEMNPENELANHFLPIAYIRADELENAEEAAQAAVERMPEDVEARINLATSLMAQDKLDEAESALRTAMELDPADAVPPLRLAELLVHQGQDYDEAMKLTERSAQLDPGEGEADAVAALALRQQGRNEEAVRRLHAAAMAHPRNVRLWLMLAAIYRDVGEDEAAARAAGMAFRFAPRRRVRPNNEAAEMPLPATESAAVGGG